MKADTTTSDNQEFHADSLTSLVPTTPVLPNGSKTGPRFFYGWVILGVASMGTFMSGPGQSYSMAAFVDPMVADLGIERSRYSLAYLVATLFSGAMLPRLGRFVDARGARVVLPMLAGLLGIACVGMSRVEGLAAFSFWLIAVRSLGQGALTLTSTWLVGQWFESRRGLALGLLGLAGSFSFMSFPALNLAMIEAYGWRTAWSGLALGEWLLLMFPAIFLLRDRSDHAHHHDSQASRLEGAAASTTDERPRLHISWTREEALRTSTFWKLMAPVTTSSMLSTGLVFHQVSILSERGVTASQSVGLLSLQAGFAAVSALVSGYWSRRFSAYRLLAMSMSCMATATLILLLPGSNSVLFAYSMLLGVAGGIQRTASPQALLAAFGHGHFGAINGIAMALMVASAALGPLPLAMAKDHFGYYDPMLIAMAILPIASALAVRTARTPRHPEEFPPDELQQESKT